MGDFSEYLSYLIFFIFFILPRIIRFLGKGRRTSAPKPSEPRPMGTPTLEEILNGAPATPPEPVYSKAEIDTFEQKIAGLSKRLDALARETDDLARLAARRGPSTEKMAPIIQSTMTPTIRKLDSRIQRLRAHPEAADATEVNKIQRSLERNENTLSVLHRMTEQRLKPDRAEILGILDTACKEAARPFRIHATRMNLPYRSEHVLTVMDDAGTELTEQLKRAKLGVAAVEKSIAELPKAWIDLISNVGMDVCFSTKGLLERLSQDLGTIAPPPSLMYLRDPRFLTAAVIHAWLPGIFGDVTATLYLGPGVLYVMPSLSTSDAAFVGTLSRRPPMPVRVFVAARTLSHMGLEDVAAQRWERWQQQDGNPTEVTLVDQGGAIQVPLPPLLAAVGHVVDYLLTDPIPHLGNYSLTQIPSLIATPAVVARMTETARDLLNREPRNAPTRVTIGAALMAVDKSPTRERLIGDLALDAMAGKGTMVAPPPVPGGRARALSVLDVGHNPRLALEAVAFAAAVAPRRNPFSR